MTGVLHDEVIRFFQLVDQLPVFQLHVLEDEVDELAFFMCFRTPEDLESTLCEIQYKRSRDVVLLISFGMCLHRGEQFRLAHLVFLQLLVVHIRSNTTVQLVVVHLADPSLYPVVLSLQSTHGFHMEDLLSLAVRFQAGDELINVLLRQDQALKDLADFLQEVLFLGIDVVLFALALAAVVVDVRLTLALRRERGAAVSALDEPAEDKGLGGVLEGLLVPAFAYSLCPVPQILCNEPLVLVRVVVALPAH
ncbi:MAG: hypothetical protein PHZ00_05600 [Candidatus Peribacteraceae bacterium]|nr:hypothetical protein [Candidatus Peribacteraceae bacterium]